MSTRLLSDAVCQSEKIEKLDPFTEIFFYRLLVNADDYGRMDARPPMLRARLFPLKNVTLGLMSDTLSTLRRVGLIDCYKAGGSPYLYIKDWDKYQQIRLKREKYPPPPGWESPMSVGEARPVGDARAQAYAHAVESESENESESYLESEGDARTKGDAPEASRLPPTREEVRAFAREKGYAADPDTFFDYYTAMNWKTKKGAPVMWRAAYATWERREFRWDSKQRPASASSFDAEDFFRAALARTCSHSSTGGAS